MFSTTIGQVSTVFIHGFLEPSRVLPIGLESLKASSPCFVKLPGYSHQSIGAYTWKDYAEPIADSCLNSNLHEITLLGDSMGAMIALQVATLCPEAISHLILYRVPYFGQNRTSATQLLQRGLDRLQDETRSYESICQTYSSEQQELLRRIGRTQAIALFQGAIASNLLEEEIKQVRHPVRIIPEGFDDRLHPQSEAVRLLTLLSDGDWVG
jgi:pimeloyl-ACP methyl ester carboxylesterase